MDNFTAFEGPPPYSDVERTPAAIQNITRETTPLLERQRPHTSERGERSFSIKAFLLHWACVSEQGDTYTHMIAGRLCFAVFFTLAILGILAMVITVFAIVKGKGCDLTLAVHIYAALAQGVGPILLLLWICVVCSRRRRITCAACFAWLVSLYFVAVMSGLVTTVVQEWSQYGHGQNLCLIVQYIPLGTLCALGMLVLIFVSVSCVAFCCCRVAGSF